MKHNLDKIGERVAIYNPVIVARLQMSLCGMEEQISGGKRMLSKKVLDTDAFLDMPLSAQALYFHLAINADDEGFIGNPKRIRDYIGAEEDDLALLIEKRFVISFKSGVVVIRHWKIHNTLRRDRSHPTLFAEEKAGLIVEDNGAYSDRLFGSIHVNQTVTALQQMTTMCQPKIR